MTPLLVNQTPPRIQDVIDQHEEDGDAAAAEAVRGLFDLDTIDIEVLRGVMVTIIF